MQDAVITVENLSKSYLLGHNTGVWASHHTLRDVIGREARNFTRKAIDVFRGRQVVQGDEVEEFWALKNVSLEVRPGEVLGIIGRNGAGKSTLLKILSRITEPTLGRITIRGRASSLLEVGTGFHPELTGRENIYLNGAILGMTQREIRAKFDEIVTFAEVERFLDTPVKHYSSGMYVRLAFAVAAHLEPEILVVDEVLAVGDTEFQKKCLGKMSAVARGGRTVLFVSHNHAAVRSLCSHALVLKSGHASDKLDVEDALDQYSSETQIPLTSSWKRPANIERSRMYFESIAAHLEGIQPKLQLVCEACIKSVPGARPVFITMEILDKNSTAIVQVEPRSEPFIGATSGSNLVTLTIELPQLVPGKYYLDFWIGTHNTETSDYIREALSIDIVDSPNPNRKFPFTQDHGFIVANAT